MVKTKRLFTYTKTLSAELFSRFSSFIQSELGIKMPPAKKVMLESRLQKRLRALQIDTFEQYYAYLFSEQGFKKELRHLFDVITTNKTDFFREPIHFECLLKSIMPDLINRNQIGRNRSLNVWSAGCSTGEEPYTLAMILYELKRNYPDFEFSIYATDISTEVLEIGSLAIYDEHKIEPIPFPFKKKYLLRSKDKNKKLVRIIPKIRAYVKFNRLNLMDDRYSLPSKMDIIFCRNVLIYFHRSTQKEIILKLCHYLIPGGFLFLGHSETLCGMDVPLVTVAPTVYQKPEKIR